MTITVLAAIIIVGLLIAGAFIASAVVGGYVQVKTAPREEMMWCHKHGHYRKGHCLPIGGTLVCPTCYLGALKEADNVALWKK